MAITPINHTQISNDFLDKYMCELTGAQVKVFLAIARKTIGWHKETDSVSISQLMKMTGISRQGVVDTISALSDKGIIIIDRSTSRKASNRYTINYENMSDGSQLSRPDVVNSVDHGSQLSRPQGSQLSRPTKEIVLNKLSKEKELSAKADHENQSPTSHQSIKHIFEQGSTVLSPTHEPYYHDGKEAKAVKFLETRYEQNPKAFELLARKFFKLIKSGDKFWSEQPFTPSAFNSLYNRIQRARAPDETQEQELLAIAKLMEV